MNHDRRTDQRDKEPKTSFSEELKQERANVRDTSKRETGSLRDTGRLTGSVSRAYDS